MSHPPVYHWIARLSGMQVPAAPDEKNRIFLLLDQQNREWWLEVAPDESVLLITTPMTGQLDANHLTPANLQHWLSLNSEVALMGGTWLGLDGDMPILTLYAQIFLAHCDEPLLDNLMGQLVGLAHDLTPRLYAAEL
ncbi:type III secretion system chaperone [Aeromonas veronii]|uniref:type III secretion system chaperone n=1 Tax=Aeromonas veronii TaxID=654 RepID=UPI0021D83E6C|nr:type III secretion system chaperone [Aeromonas veronii]UYB70265.1 type III secretion system chaperone [Aeromonas veronii]